MPVLGKVNYAMLGATRMLNFCKLVLLASDLQVNWVVLRQVIDSHAAHVVNRQRTERVWWSK